MYSYHGPPKLTCLEVFMVNNLGFMVLGAHGRYIPHQKSYSSSIGSVMGLVQSQGLSFLVVPGSGLGFLVEAKAKAKAKAKVDPKPVGKRPAKAAGQGELGILFFRNSRQVGALKL